MYEYKIENKTDFYGNVKLIRYRKIGFLKIKDRKWEAKATVYMIYNDETLTEKDIKGFLGFIEKQEKTEMLNSLKKELTYQLEKLSGTLSEEMKKHEDIRSQIHSRWFELQM